MNKKYIIGLVIFVIFLVIIISFRYEDPFPKSTKKVINSVILVGFKGRFGEPHITGSGFIVDKRGYILTAEHVFTDNNVIKEIEKAFDITIKPPFNLADFIEKHGIVWIRTKMGWQEFNISLKKNALLELKDIILLEIKSDSFLEYSVIISKIKPEKILIGEEIGFIGWTTWPEVNLNLSNPPLFIGKGIISNTNLEISGQKEVPYTINSVPAGGNSGGPVFLSKNGEVIGLINRGPQQGVVIVAKIYEISQLIEDIEKNKGK